MEGRGEGQAEDGAVVMLPGHLREGVKGREMGEGGEGRMIAGQKTVLLNYTKAR